MGAGAIKFPNFYKIVHTVHLVNGNYERQIFTQFVPIFTLWDKLAAKKLLSYKNINLATKKILYNNTTNTTIYNDST